MAASLFSSARLVNKPDTLNIDPPAHLIKAITSSKNGQTKNVGASPGLINSKI